MAKNVLRLPRGRLVRENLIKQQQEAVGGIVAIDFFEVVFPQYFGVVKRWDGEELGWVISPDIYVGSIEYPQYPPV